jgi:trans-aconitate 2-methyltransferase
VSQPQYLFGDTESAAERLKLLGSIYQESTRAFLAKVTGPAYFPLAVDLGCGLGLTTRLIAETLQCDRVIGLDTSPSFIELARRNSAARLSFEKHDVTAMPFPCGRPNLIFARFLLTHLRDPSTVAAKWATQLQPRGLLLFEETDAIRTDHPVFARYLRIVEAMLAGHSNQLYAGRLLARLNFDGALRRQASELRPLAVRNRDAACMFLLNLRTWKENEFVRANYSSDSILKLAKALEEIGNNESSSRDIEWDIRQAAWSKG